MFCYNAVSFVKLCRPIGRRNGVLYESKTYDVSGNVHDHCPDDFVVEAMLPPLAPIPGIKLGLANVVTLWLLYYATWKDALCVLLMRILIASMVTGQMVSFSYSLCGGLFCFVAMALLFRLLGKKHIPFISVIGALFHNLGQICIAMVILRSASILVYLPMLTISGILTGAFTGLCAWFASRRLRKDQVWFIR